MEWDINDATIPNTINHYDTFQDWPDDHIRLVYPISSEPGWAMRNTNNHNVHILKKSCLGVLMCSRRCATLLPSGGELRLRPAICDKARKKQLGRCCPKCGMGTLHLVPCKGNSGFPCTHFWRHSNNAIFFQAKGVHDHARPELKSSSSGEIRKGLGKVGALQKSLTAPAPGKVRKQRRIKKELVVSSSPSVSKKRIGVIAATPHHAITSKPQINHPHPHQLPNNNKNNNNNNNHYYNHCNNQGQQQQQQHSHPQPFPSQEQKPAALPQFLPEQCYTYHPDPETLSQNKLYGGSPYPSSYPYYNCCGCGHPPAYCTCNSSYSAHGVLPMPEQQQQLNHATPATAIAHTSDPENTNTSSFIPLNNNQDTFKPSDIFNFEVNLNFNYSAAYGPYAQVGLGQQGQGGPHYQTSGDNSYSHPHPTQYQPHPFHQNLNFYEGCGWATAASASASAHGIMYD